MRQIFLTTIYKNSQADGSTSILTWGGPGSGDGQFGDGSGPEGLGPYGIEVDDVSGKVYVMDTANHRIKSSVQIQRHPPSPYQQLIIHRHFGESIPYKLTEQRLAQFQAT